MADSKQTLKDELEQERRKKEWAEPWMPPEPGDMLISTLTHWHADSLAR
jgi:hypothetical protein